MTMSDWTPLTDEDHEAIDLLMNSHFAEHVREKEATFLESISEQEAISPKQRTWFDQICDRVLK